MHTHHQGHSHAHGERRTVVSRKLIISTVATLMFVVVEFAIGTYANSLALIGDAFHNFTDALALILALIAVIIERRPPTLEKTYGYQRAGILVAFVNAGTLVAFTIYIFVEAWHRFRNPEPVNSFWMLIAAATGLLLNSTITYWLREEGRKDLNVRSAVIHMLGDAVSSAGIIIAAIVIRYTGLNVIDPIISVLIGAMVLWSSWGILREAVNLLLEGTPSGIESKKVQEDLASLEGVFGVHHLHIWAIGPSRAALSCHLLLGDVSLKRAGEILKKASAILSENYHIEHSTIQFEYLDCPEDELFCLLPSPPKEVSH